MRASMASLWAEERTVSRVRERGAMSSPVVGAPRLQRSTKELLLLVEALAEALALALALARLRLLLLLLLLPWVLLAA